MNDIHIVMGSTGEYSDHTEWPVAAYGDEALAQQHVELASACYRILAERKRVHEEENSYDWQFYSKPENKNPYDPDMAVDYTGTNYSIMSVPVSRKLPAVGGDWLTVIAAAAPSQRAADGQREAG